MKKQNREVIVFHWKDASMQRKDQLTRSEWGDAKLIEGIVAGHLIHEDKERIVIGMDLFFEQQDIEEDNFRQVGVYPKSGIIKIIKKFILK